MRILSLDLGITTGYAVIESPDSDLEPPTILEAEHFHISVFERILKDLRDSFMISHSVAEPPVIIRGPMGDQLQEIISITKRELMRQVVFVEPSRWKPSPWGKYPLPRGTSPHVKDAIRLGLWYYASLQRQT